MFPHLREAGDVSTRSRGAVPRPEAGMRASCPFPSLHLAGGASHLHRDDGVERHREAGALAAAKYRLGTRQDRGQCHSREKATVVRSEGHPSRSLPMDTWHQRKNRSGGDPRARGERGRSCRGLLARRGARVREARDKRIRPVPRGAGGRRACPGEAQLRDLSQSARSADGRAGRHRPRQRACA